MATVVNPKTKQIYELEDDIDVKTGVNTAVESALKQGYQQVYKVANPKTGETFNVEDLKSALGQGYMVKEEYEGRQDAKKRYKDGATKVESSTRAWFDGGSQGLDDEIVAGVKAIGNKVYTGGASDFTKDYSTERDDLRENKKLLEEAHPITYTGTKLASGVIGGALAGAGVLKAVPGVATAMKVGSNALGSSLAATGVKLGAAGALQSGVTGFGEAEGDLASQLGQVEDAAAIGGVTGAALPLLGKGASLAASQVKRVIPGINNAFKSVNSAASGMASPGLGNKNNTTAYKKFLDNPESYEAARVAHSDLGENPQKYADVLNKLGGELEDVNRRSQDDFRRYAAQANMEDSNYTPAVAELEAVFAKEADIATKANTSNDYRKGIDEARRAFRGEDLESLRGTADELQEGKRLHIGRKLVDDKLAALENKTGSKSTTEYRNLLELRAKIDDAMKGTTSKLESGVFTEDADAAFQSYAGARDAIKGATQAPLGDVSNAKAYRFFKKSAGDEKTIQIDDVINKVGNFEEFLNISDRSVAPYLNELKKTLEGPQRAGELARLAAASGLTTGKSVLPAVIGGVGYAMGGFGAAPIAAASLPVTNPAMYLALINAYNRKEKAAVEMMNTPGVRERLNLVMQAFPRYFSQYNTEEK